MTEEGPEKGQVWAFERGRSENRGRWTKSLGKKVVQKPWVVYFFLPLLASPPGLMRGGSLSIATSRNSASTL